MGGVKDVDSHFLWELSHMRPGAEGIPMARTEKVYHLSNSTGDFRNAFLKTIRQVSLSLLIQLLEFSNLGPALFLCMPNLKTLRNCQIFKIFQILDFLKIFQTLSDFKNYLVVQVFFIGV